MCGISGIIHLNKTACEAELKAMSNKMESRGPDSQGFFFDDHVGLAHNRLAIIDLTDAGAQPMTDQESGLVVCFNGEIYNHLEIREQLAKEGVSFSSHSDTETLLKAWKAWGKKAIDHLNGMFAFAIWDPRNKTTFIVRDRLGIKPLYYHKLESGELIFASELKGLTAHSKFKKALNYQAVEDYLSFGHIPDPLTIYQNVHKLPPAHLLEINPQGQLKLDSYWQVSFQHRYQGSFEDAKHEYRQKFEEAVKLQLMSDVPLSGFLSGGVDSSSIVAVMAEHSSEQISTCSIGFEEAKFDESSYALEVAKAYNSKHYTHTETLDEHHLIEQILETYDEPFADSSAVPTLKLCKMARTHCTVALSGDGGDELLGGYSWYQSYLNNLQRKRSIPAALRKPGMGKLLNTMLASLPFSNISKSISKFAEFTNEDFELFMAFQNYMKPFQKQQVYADRFKRELGGYASSNRFIELAQSDRYYDDLSFAQLIDFDCYLPSDILTKTDRASMEHSLEVRVPFLDHTFVEWCSGLPSEFKLQLQQGKYIHKKCMEDKLSQDILYRPKQGFTIPLERWLSEGLRPELNKLRQQSMLYDMGIFEQASFSKQLDQQMRNLKDGRNLWSILLLNKFLEKNFA